MTKSAFLLNELLVFGYLKHDLKSQETLFCRPGMLKQFATEHKTVSPELPDGISKAQDPSCIFLNYHYRHFHLFCTQQ